MAGFLKFILRLGAGGIGFVLGVVATIAVMAAILIVGEVWSSRQPITVHAEISGADVTRHGGVSIALKNGRGSITQACNGVCDNLIFEQDSGDNFYKAEVRDRSGACILCNDGEYVTKGLGLRWRIGGQDKLVLQRSAKSHY